MADICKNCGLEVKGRHGPNDCPAELRKEIHSNIRYLAQLEARAFPNHVWREILQERSRQVEQWGGEVHDDLHSNYDWIAYLTKHVGKAVQWPFKLADFRYQMVRVAALAVAAIEWCDRKEAKLHEPD